MNKKLKKQDDSINMKKPEFKHPVFCFRHLQKYSYPDSKDYEFFIGFIERLQKLGNLGWDEINKSPRHTFGTEKIPKKALKPKNLPSIVTEDVKELTVFRAAGNNRPFLGLRISDTFHVILF